ncbi:MAG TPA: response regulator [Pirellulales bacterium]|nr:response regulator [Pirellulales bacterium]
MSNALRIFVVDDSRDGAMTSTMLLRSLGHEVRSAHEGLVAIEEAPRFKPHLVLVDIGMSPLDGYEIAKRLRREPDLADTSLVAVTGYSDENHRERAEDAGFVEYLVKPVGLDQLRELIERVFT